MRSHFRALAMTASLLSVTACSLDSSAPSFFDSDLAFASAPAGLDLVSSSYAPSASNGMPWGGPERGRGGGPGMGGFMGGGLGDSFIGNAPRAADRTVARSASGSTTAASSRRPRAT
jgi:hypothetical protein